MSRPRIGELEVLAVLTAPPPPHRRRQRWASTVFNVAEIPGPAWRGYFELRDASQVDELEAAVEARLPSVAFRMPSE